MIWITICFLSVYIVLCLKVSAIGKAKTEKKYFWWSLMFSPILALLMIIAEPEKEKKRWIDTK